ncbi:hypothetical protein AYO46_03250 [Betaproteobacteria bacterium SCGC AG-212-J23]|nr:hypothetical protein AYO46_03250 [Betaproteobacteria bacterium SCGC AG-212-J23]
MLLLAGCASAPPPPGDAIPFGLLGDTPYNDGEIQRLEGVIDAINRADLAFVVHVGDIGSARNACNDEWLQARKAQFGRIRHPFVLLPGDNEWTDCKDQLGRLAAWRRTFCFQERIPLERQPGEYCEHVRWEAGGFVFVALNVQGSNNNVTHAEEHGARMKAVYAWLDEAVRAAQGKRGLIVLMQANPFVVLPHDGYAELRARLAALGERMPGRVTLVHGDTHLFHDDEPIPGVRRVEVWGSPFVRWLAAGVGEGGLTVRQGP